MSTQPKALELADEYRPTMNAGVLHLWAADSRDELRRLHAALEASEASDAESLRLYRAARERADKLHALNAQMLEALVTADRTFAENGLLACHAARQEICASIAAAKGQA